MKRFLEENLSNLNELAAEQKINLEDPLAYSNLLNNAITNNKITESKVDEFLIEELNYGRIKNVFVSFIQEVVHLNDEERVVKMMNALIRRGYKNHELVKKSPYVNNLRKSIPKGEKELIYFDIEKML